MPDNINVGNPGPGPAVTPVKTDQLSDGSHVQYTKLMSGTADSTAVIPGSTVYGLAVDVRRAPDPTSPQVSYVTSSTVAAGATVDLDSQQITTNKTAYLAGLLLSSTVTFKATLSTVAEGIESAPHLTRIIERSWDYFPPGRTYHWVTGTSNPLLDAFRVTVTSLDPSESATVYISFLFDQVS